MKPKMMKRNSQFQKALAGACSILLMLCAGEYSLAQQSAPANPSASSSANGAVAATRAVEAIPQANPASATTLRGALSSPIARMRLGSPMFKEMSETAASGQAGDAQQGIKVHGHWVIDVKNPDGTLATHREFENSLTGSNQGQLLLGGLLSGYYVAGDYAIELGSGICAPAGSCDIVASQTGQPGSYLCSQNQCSATLKYAVSFFPANSMVMSGSVTAGTTGTLDEVSTVYNVCDNTNGFTGGLTPVLPTSPTTFTPAQCVGANVSAFITYFTSTTVTPSINITQGQSISVTVTITFS